MLIKRCQINNQLDIFWVNSFDSSVAHDRPKHAPHTETEESQRSRDERKRKKRPHSIA